MWIKKLEHQKSDFQPINQLINLCLNQHAQPPFTSHLNIFLFNWLHIIFLKVLWNYLGLFVYYYYSLVSRAYLTFCWSLQIDLSTSWTVIETRRKTLYQRSEHKPVIPTLLHTSLWCRKCMHSRCQIHQAVGPGLEMASTDKTNARIGFHLSPLTKDRPRNYLMKF